RYGKSSLPAALQVNAGIPSRSTVAPISADNALRKLNLSRSIGLMPPHHRARRAEFASLSAAGTTNIARRWHRQRRDRCQLVAALLVPVTASPTNRDKSRPQNAAPIAGRVRVGLVRG